LDSLLGVSFYAYPTLRTTHVEMRISMDDSHRQSSIRSGENLAVLVKRRAGNHDTPGFCTQLTSSHDIERANGDTEYNNGAAHDRDGYTCQRAAVIWDRRSGASRHTDSKPLTLRASGREIDRVDTVPDHIRGTSQTEMMHTTRQPGTARLLTRRRPLPRTRRRVHASKTSLATESEA
jgi:hypothetical protein